MSTDAGVDGLVDSLEAALRRVEVAECSSVRLTASEVELHECFQRIRDLMLEVLRDSSDRARLLHVFGGDCFRIGRIRAVLDKAKSVLSSKADGDEGAIQDTLASVCLETCLSIEEVLRDLGHDKALSSAKEESRRKINEWWGQIHGIPSETVLNTVQEQHMLEATIGETELLEDSGANQPDANGHQVANCQYTVLSSESNRKSAEHDESGYAVIDCNFNVQNVSSTADSVCNNVNENVQPTDATSAKDAEVAFATAESSFSLANTRTDIAGTAEALPAKAIEVVHVPAEHHNSPKNTDVVEGLQQQAAEAGSASAECGYSLESRAEAKDPVNIATKRRCYLEGLYAVTKPLADPHKLENSSVQYSCDQWQSGPHGRLRTDANRLSDKSAKCASARWCPFPGRVPMTTSSNLGGALTKRAHNIEGIRSATIIHPRALETGGYKLVDHHCSIGPEYVQPSEVAEADGTGQHSNGKGREPVAEVAVATACTMLPRAESAATPCRSRPLKRFISMQGCMPHASHHAASSTRVEAGQSTLRASAQMMPVIGNFAAASSPVVGKGQQPLSPSSQSINFRTPASSWRTCDATEPVCAHIVKPYTGVSSTSSSNGNSSSRAAVMSNRALLTARKREGVVKPLAQSRVKRYNDGLTIDGGKSVGGFQPRECTTASSGGIVVAIPPSTERRWQATRFTPAPIAITRAPLVIAEPISMTSCGCPTIPLHHQALLSNPWSPAALAPCMSIPPLAVGVPAH